MLETFGSETSAIVSSIHNLAQGEFGVTWRPHTDDVPMHTSKQKRMKDEVILRTATKREAEAQQINSQPDFFVPPIHSSKRSLTLDLDLMSNLKAELSRNEKPTEPRRNLQVKTEERCESRRRRERGKAE